jgi:hypothetical protein
VARPRRHFGLIVAASLVAATGCPSATDEPPGPDTSLLPSDVGLVIVESDFDGTGYVQAIDSVTHGLVDQYGTAYDQDPKLRRLVDPHDGAERLFIVGSTDGKLTQIDRRGHVLAAYDLHDPGDGAAGADPYDVAIAPDGALWVTRYSKPTMLVLEPDGTPRATVDLSSFAPANGGGPSPRMSAVAIVHGTAYVALQRLDGAANPTNVSQIVSIDTSTSPPYVAKPFVDLPVPDPDDHFTLSLDDPPKLRIACIGGPISVPPVPGAIVEIDLAEQNPVPRIVVDGRTTNTFYPAYDVSSDGYGYVIEASEATHDNATALRRLDPATGQLDAPWYSTDLYRLWQVAVVDDLLLVADRTASSPGIQVFDRTDGAHLGEIATHLPPVQFIVVRNQTH